VAGLAGQLDAVAGGNDRRLRPRLEEAASVMFGGLRPSQLAMAGGGTRLSSTLTWMQAHFQTPLIRNGYSLVASTGMTSLLGLVYWVLAARLYSIAEIGLNAALISTMMALGGIAQLNLGSVLTRFLPSLGRPDSQRMIVGTYGAGMLAALVSCILFLLGVHAWAPSLRLLADSPWLAAWFTAGTMIWTVFSLQDGALAGLRRAIWVPIENTLFALAKIVLLLLFADSTWRAWGPFASWTLPLLATVLPVNFLIFRRLLRSPRFSASGFNTPVAVRSVVRFFVADFAGTLFFMAAVGLAPILVVEQVGAAGNAVFYLTWTIAYSLYLVSKSMGVSLVAEGAADPWQSKVLAFGALIHTMGLLAIAVVILTVAAPMILQLFGPSYMTEGSALLRVLALSALPFGFTSMFLGLARVEGRMTAVVTVQAILAVLVLGLGVPLLDRFGALGMGIAWLVAQVAIALVLGVVAWRSVGWSQAALQSLVGMSATPAHSAFVRRIRPFLIGRATANVVRDATARIVDRAADARSWRFQGMLRANRQFCMLALGPRADRRTAVMKVATSSAGIAALRRESEVLHIFRSAPGLQDFCNLLPNILAEDHGLRGAYIVERVPGGVPGHVLFRDAGRREQAAASAASAIAGLHSWTASISPINDAWMVDWIDRPIEEILSAASRAISSDRADPAFESIRRSQRAAWSGRTVALGWCHGDFIPAGIRFSEDGRRVTGIVDWASARRNAPAALDLCHLAITMRMSNRKQDIGDVVCDLLREPRWSADEQRCFAGQAFAWAESEIQAIALLTWLNKIASHLANSDLHIGHCLWTAAKIERILCAFKTHP
jgi:O-antigen/teichoic acid export membrane protein